MISHQLPAPLSLHLHRLCVTRTDMHTVCRPWARVRTPKQQQGASPARCMHLYLNSSICLKLCIWTISIDIRLLFIQGINAKLKEPSQIPSQTEPNRYTFPHVAWWEGLRPPTHALNFLGNGFALPQTLPPQVYEGPHPSNFPRKPKKHNY